MQVRMQMEVKKQRAGVTPQYRSVLPRLTPVDTVYSLRYPPRLSLELPSGRRWISLTFLTSFRVVQWDAVCVLGPVP